MESRFLEAAQLDAAVDLFNGVTQGGSRCFDRVKSEEGFHVVTSRWRAEYAGRRDQIRSHIGGELSADLVPVVMDELPCLGPVGVVAQGDLELS